MNISGRPTKITDLPKATTVNENDYLIIETEEGTKAVSATELSGGMDYESLNNLPSINGIELTGDKSTEDLKIKTSEINDDEISETGTWSSEKISEELKNVDIGIATTKTAGKVKPDGTSITISEDGTISSSSGYIVFPEFEIDTATGHLSATGGAGVEFSIDAVGHLQSEVL